MSAKPCPRCGEVPDYRVSPPQCACDCPPTERDESRTELAIERTAVLARVGDVAISITAVGEQLYLEASDAGGLRYSEGLERITRAGARLIASELPSVDPAPPADPPAVDPAPPADPPPDDNWPFPWPRARSHYDTAGPEKAIVFVLGAATFRVAPTALVGVDTGRMRFFVRCLTCDEVIHPATTGPASYCRAHAETKHGYLGRR